MAPRDLSERYIMPEPGTVVTLTFSNGYTEEMQFNGVNDKYVQVTTQGQHKLNSNIILEAFVVLAQLPERG